MDLNLFDTPKNIYKKACDISENCGYVTTLSKVEIPEEIRKLAVQKKETLDIGKIEIVGEDCPDSLNVTNILYFNKDGITKIQKVAEKTEWTNDESKQILIQVIEWVEGKWVEIFNKYEHEEYLKKDELYQRALEKEGKTDHPLYTGYRKGGN